MDKMEWTKENIPLIAQRADPYIYRSLDGSYYFTASVPEYDRVVLRRADSIQELSDAEEKTLWKMHESGPMSRHIWAPELHYVFGGWYIYFAAGDAEDEWKIRPYVLRCMGDDPMVDEWQECGMMQAADGDDFSFRAFSLDATVFYHNEEYYFIWAEKTGVGKQISNLYIAKMASPVKLKTAQVLLTTPDYAWERIGFWVNEGPAVLVHGNRIFVTFSASETGTCYCMGLLAADKDADLLDPGVWVKKREPVLITDRKRGIFGPGHNSFVKSKDGTEDICVYHARAYEKIEGNPLYDPNRNTMLLKVAYDTEGYPVFNLNNNSGIV